MRIYDEGGSSIPGGKGRSLKMDAYFILYTKIKRIIKTIQILIKIKIK